MLKKIASIFIIFFLVMVIGFSLYKKIYAYETYPDGSIKRTVVYQIFKNRYKFTKYYETGELQKIYYTKSDKVIGPVLEYYRNGNISTMSTYINDSIHGDLLIYKDNGNLIAVNKYKNGKMYYKKVYEYDNNNNLADSAYSLMPVIYEERRDIDVDSIYYKVGVIVDGLDFECNNLDLFYELYEYKRDDGLFPYTPSHVLPLEDCSTKDIGLSTRPHMILFTEKKPDSLFFFVMVRNMVDGQMRENDPVIISMKK